MHLENPGLCLIGWNTEMVSIYPGQQKSKLFKSKSVNWFSMFSIECVEWFSCLVEWGLFVRLRVVGLVGWIGILWSMGGHVMMGDNRVIQWMIIESYSR